MSDAGVWAPPLTCCRRGASHRRRGLAGQDSVAAASLRSDDGVAVQVMAVADGHGSPRHRRSDVGSRLACATAVAQVREVIESSRLQGGGAWARRPWSRWLARELPTAIHAAWLAAIEADWRRQRDGDGGDGDPQAPPFTPVLYGSTLAVVVMTPCWWGYTGLGDWDLVVVEGPDRARLASEEKGVDPQGGEATLSLCLEAAPDLFASRSRLHPLPRLGEGERFAVVLSTDGIRKSCVADGDFLRLCAWMAASAATARPTPSNPEACQPELSEALDRVSAQGSGDDVSVAVGLLQGRTMGMSSATAAALP